MRRFGSVVWGLGFGVWGFPRCRHKERVTVLFYCMGARQNKQSTTLTEPALGQEENEKEKSGFSSSSFDSSFDDAIAETGRGAEAATLCHKPSLCELRTRRRCLQTCGGRRRIEMKKAIAAGFRGKTAPKPRGQVATALGRGPALWPLSPNLYNNQPAGVRLHHEQSTHMV